MRSSGGRESQSFHAVGVTATDERFIGITPGREIESAGSPLKSGVGGDSSFMPGEEGIAYYIRIVPGHREQGMVAKIFVGDVSAIA